MVDANVLLRYSLEPDRSAAKYWDAQGEYKLEVYEQDRKLYWEAKAAVEELAAREKLYWEAKAAVEELAAREKLYYTKDIIEEVERKSVDPPEKNGLGLSEEKAAELVNEIKKEVKEGGLFTSLEKETEKRIEREAQQRTEKIAELEKKTEAEKNTLKEEIKKELKNETEKKEAQEFEKAKEKLEEVKNKPLEEIAVAKKSDLQHVAVAKAHDLNVLTFNKKDFQIHENLSVTRPFEPALGLRPEEVKTYRDIRNPDHADYKGTKTVEVELKSGHKAELNIKGLDQTKDERGFKDRAEEVIYHPQTIAQLENWKAGDQPVRVSILDSKPDKEPDPSTSGGSGPNQKQNDPMNSPSAKPLSEAATQKWETDPVFRQQVQERLQEMLKAQEQQKALEQTPPTPPPTTTPQQGI